MGENMSVSLPVNKRIDSVFCDVDGTLISSDYHITPDTVSAIRKLNKEGIPFVIVSGRSPSGIYPLFKELGFAGPLMAYSGALVLDEDGSILYQNGLSLQLAQKVTDFIEENMDMAWNAYSVDDWVSSSRKDPRILDEESKVKALSREGKCSSYPEAALVNKIMGICDPKDILVYEKLLADAFPECTVVKSAPHLIEVMIKGANKGKSIREYCRIKGFDLSNTIAFGDNFNDMEMLETVGTPIVMGNAPEQIRAKFSFVTADNNHDGIAKALDRLLISSGS